MPDADQSFVRWLHIPKAGSSFINTILRFGCGPATASSMPVFAAAIELSRWLALHPQTRCTRLHAPWQGHVPVRRNERRLVGLFRSPPQRLLSGYFHHEHGKNASMIAPGMSDAQRALMRRHARGDPAAYARWPGIAACATKMLLGFQCAATHRPSRADISRAIRVVRQNFVFVGLQEHWKTSVCIFHARFINGSTPDAAELQLTHAGPERLAGAARSEHGPDTLHLQAFRYDEGLLRGFVDEADTLVYEAARSHFWQEAAATGCM